MKAYTFDLLLQNDVWQKDSFVTVDSQGIIVDVSSEKPVDTEVEQVRGYCLPGFQNAHSHAFQYAMAGLAEIHPDPSKSDDFWSWRNTMYKIALSIDPDQLEAIAAMLYAEMLRHGYTHVAEFHYLHHDRSGNPFENRAEMGERLLAAADRVGMNITLVPMFYQMGGFGKSAEPEQRRFLSNSLQAYLELLAASEQVVQKYSSARLGVGLHSLRAVNEESMQGFFEQRTKGLPFHIHVSEQLKEVKECLEYYGKRPVEWLLDNTPIDSSFHLVHATHLTNEETTGIANSGAHVVLCPSTEGNLGDGVFPLKAFQEAGGKWSIGTDSHIGLSPLEELRILDYGQRLTSHRRDQLINSENGDSGHFGFDMSLKAGRAAMGNKATEYFNVGRPFDAIVIDATRPLIATSSADKLLSTLIYAGDPSFLLGTITNGTWRVRNGLHSKYEEVLANFNRAMAGIGIR
ncbi:MAG: formimidoylglutamate deiminase [Cyclobacteriaceae bacterium]